MNHIRAIELLCIGTGYPNAEFREGQLEAIETIVDGNNRLLVVQKTGWGKSFVYFIATKLLREQGKGTALLISPLLSLMRNQIAAAEKMGLHAVTINTDNKDEWDNVNQQILSGKVDILLISPERLANQDFVTKVLNHIASNISLLVIDEAHCISDWGHDFRPDYRRIERIIRNLPQNLRVLATTATANNRVMEDLISVLGPNIKVLKGDLNRPSLTLQTIIMPKQADRLAWLAEQLRQIEGSGIIYTLTIRDANQVASWLREEGFNVMPYSSKMENRAELEDQLLNNQLKALVATTALGMGFDKPDLSFVFHYQMPGSVVAYYQQVGRAGRALENAYGVLLSGIEDDEITNFFIESAFPKKEHVENLLSILEKSINGLSVQELQNYINLSNGKINQILKILSLESPAPLVKQGSKWVKTATPLPQSFWDRVERLTHLRYQEQSQMKEYLHLSFGEHMRFLIQALDGDTQNLDRNTFLLPLSETVNPEYVQKAVEFLKRGNLPIEPRKQLPSGGLSQFGSKRKIPEEYQAEEGRVLSYWGDAGWGSLVKQGKYHDNNFSNELVDAVVTMINSLQSDPKPTWVTCVPSLRHPGLVPNFAKRVADKLGLPFAPIIQKIRETKPQKSMENSNLQAKNLDGAFALTHRPYNTPVLLIDDMVDSRWTFTICTYLLKQAGSGAVFPVALAQTTRNEL
ncbi:RecQ family ATP-dependent DNA helicase [Avibacterium endocarditidis]|uniref:RecQ family ATP-dependent DNA helicase n=1 Tax=Avibacterium endocarditidis TaxID=380674 RepID=UPI0039FD7FD7